MKSPIIFVNSEILAPEMHRMADVTIYVWGAKYDSSVLALIEGFFTGEHPSQKEVGHSALLIDDTYVSVYPPGEGGGYLSPQEEIESEGIQPSYIQTIHWLNSDEMLSSWERMAEDNYNVTWASCSNICDNLLIKGAQLSSVSQRFYPEAHNWFMRYMTDPSKLSDPSWRDEIINNYPSSTLFAYLASAYLESNFENYIEGLGVKFRTTLTSIFDTSNSELGRTPSDIIITGKILTSDTANQLVQQM